MLKEYKFKSNQLLDKWSAADEIIIAKQKKEKQPFDWSKYPSKQVKPREPIKKLSVNTDSSKTPVPPSKSPVPPSLLKAKSPVPTPVPVKIITNGETKQMNSNVPKIIEPQPKPKSPPPPPKILEPEPIQPPKEEPAPIVVAEPAEAPVRPISAARPSSSQKKTFFPNQTTRIYSPLNTSLQEVSNPESDDTNKMDLSDVKRPPSSASKDESSEYIKNDTYPTINRPKSSLLNETNENLENKSGVDAENLSMESSSVSIKPTLSPESNDTNEQMNDQMNEQTSEV